MGRRKPDEDVRRMARTFARDSIVTEATARLVEQVMIEAHRTMCEIVREQVTAEREACAKIAENDTSFDMLQDFGMQSHSAQLRTNIAEAIRARST